MQSNTTDRYARRIAHMGYALTAIQWRALGAVMVGSYEEERPDGTYGGRVEFSGYGGRDGYCGDGREAAAITALDRVGGDVSKALEIIEAQRAIDAIADLGRGLAALSRTGVHGQIIHRLGHSRALDRVLAQAQALSEVAP